MTIGEVWNLQIRGNVSETVHIHGLHFLEGAGPGLDGAALIAAWQGAPQTAYRAMFSTNGAVQPVQLIHAQKVCGTVPLPSATEVAPITANQTGTRATAATDFLPAYVAAVVNMRGVASGRRYSGKFFLGGLYETDVTGNSLTSVYTTLVQAYIDALRTTFVTPDPYSWRLFNFSNLLADGDAFHTKRNPNPPPDRIADPVTAVQCPDAGSPVQSLILNPRPTTMRSRKVGHGL